MEQKSAAIQSNRSQSQRTRSNGIKTKMRPDNVKTGMQQANNETLARSNLDTEIDENITENIAALKEQVEIAIKSVDENLIDSMLVGQTKIQKNKAVILSWSLDQNGPLPQSLESQDASDGDNQTKDDSNTQEDGIVLYVAIKMKKKTAAGPPQVEEDPNNNCSSELSRQGNQEELEGVRNWLYLKIGCFSLKLIEAKYFAYRI